MLVLGIDTSCDDTAIGVVENGSIIHSNVIASQNDLLKIYGGVYPEMACRRHIEMCEPVLRQALENIPLEEIDLIATTIGPGLVGALLIGFNFGKALALATKKPFVAVNHIEAHLTSAMIEQKPPLPALGVVISGGHTSLVLIRAVGEYELIGQTQDDAIGEAFDKVARMLNLPFPGGPAIEELAKEGDPNRYPFKGGTIKNRPFDFSFSGLKTAVLYETKKGNYRPADIAASFQRAAFDSLLKKVFVASQKYHPKSIVLGGGVSSSKTLRSQAEAMLDLPLFWPPFELCLDNGAMIAALGYHLYQKRGADSQSLNVRPRIPFHEKTSSPSSPHCNKLHI
ncbi:MAG: tRNA N6-adenosine threonylcarbamoyltransferase [Chlamydiales bacterium]|nr:tRNA N6-adenosine threonylcarbamoyltransferase [Chlamydiales bacterium]MCH9620450.1 tRNA N6-adenosine threonylcarbamoyltransferase [Chlamydiales bacterium]MCH9623436.1 tRNA N6-adenosine threonylcarbamoyltransferase [Chlamydiales bacterium]